MDTQYTFKNIVVGTANRTAVRAAKSVANRPGTLHNPLFIWAEGTGLGKTHLMRAIGYAVCRQRPKARIREITAEKFASECSRATRAKKLAAHHARYRGLDCLLIPDIQFYPERTRKQLSHIVNGLARQGKQVVVTSDRAPKDLLWRDRKFASQLGSGRVVVMKEPDKVLRLAIVREKCKVEKLAIRRDVMRFVATRIKKNIRELEGALIRLWAYQSVTGKRATVKEAQDVLKDSIEGSNA